MVEIVISDRVSVAVAANILTGQQNELLEHLKFCHVIRWFLDLRKLMVRCVQSDFKIPDLLGLGVNFFNKSSLVGALNQIHVCL